MQPADGRRRAGGARRLAALRAALLVLGLWLPSTATAQRGEIAVLGGAAPGVREEFDRVLAIGSASPYSYIRQRGERTLHPFAGVAATFAVRGHVFAELGLSHQTLTRSIASTAGGDHTGPFIRSTEHDGALTAFWIGPAYRAVDRERVALTLLAAPTVLVLTGDAYDTDVVFVNAPTRGTTIGLMLGLRARYWLTERVGAQLAVENVSWNFSLSPHPNDVPARAPETYRRTPRQQDLRLHLGATFKLF